MSYQHGYVEEGHAGRATASAKAGMGVLCLKNSKQVGLAAAH